MGDKLKKYDDPEWKIDEVVIPPVIRHLHNRLKIQGYRRYRMDPLFLHKTCNVCEHCFLGYAKLSSSNFQIAEPIRLDGSGALERKRKKRQKEIEDMMRLKDESRWMPMDKEKSPDNLANFTFHS